MGNHAATETILMRSLLFVPGDSERKLGKALDSGADALIVDLEDSVSAASKPAARAMTAAFLTSARRRAGRPRLYVRVNALNTGMTDDDLEAVAPCGPDGIMLPKAERGADVVLLDAKVSTLEALDEIPVGTIRILAIATETARALFNMGSYAGASARLEGIAWGAEDLSADIGAVANRDAAGYTDLFLLARSLCLAGAAAAEVPAIDTVFTDFRDQDGLRAECDAAVRDGFAAKMAIHPAQVPVINEAFTPSEAMVAEAEAIVRAFDEAGDAGVTSLGGEMLDRPHLRRAERILARAGAARKPGSPD